MDAERFKAGNGTETPVAEVHADLFLRPSDKTRYADVKAYQKEVLRFLNLVGVELWTIVFVTRPDDDVHTFAKAALTQGDRDAFAILLDLLEEHGVFGEAQIAEARCAARLWQEGGVNRELDDRMRRLYGPPVEKRKRLHLDTATSRVVESESRHPPVFAAPGGVFIPNWGTE